MTGPKIGDIVRMEFSGMEGVRGRLVEEVSPGVWAVEFHDGLADVFAEGWFEVLAEVKP